MFFNNLSIYKFKEAPNYNQSEFEAALEQDAFRHCGGQELSTLGWSTVFGKHGSRLSHFSNRKVLVCAKREEKVLPPAVINEMVAEKVDQIEQEENRIVKKRERDDIKENIYATVLPQAFTKSSLIHAFIDMDSGYLFVNSSTYSKAEEVLSLLRKSLGTLPVVPAFSNIDLDMQLTSWLENHNAPGEFGIGTDAEMEEPADSATKANLKGFDLAGEEVKSHLDSGLRVTKLGLKWGDRISFKLQSNGLLTQISYSDITKEKNADIPREDLLIKLDADFVLTSGELSRMLDELVDALISTDDADESTEAEISLSQFQDENGNDTFYEEAKAYIQQTQAVSVSRLQRKFRIGYNRAARLVEQLEQNDLITAPNHNGIREVLIF